MQEDAEEKAAAEIRMGEQFGNSASENGSVGASFTFGALIVRAGFCAIQLLSWQKRKKARRRSSSLPAVSGEQGVRPRARLHTREKLRLVCGDTESSYRQRK